MAFNNVDNYVLQLQQEKNSIEKEFPHAKRLLEKEISRIESGEEFTSATFTDIHKGKSIRLQVKVVVPVKDHPNFNFVGKLLGPKGNSLKRLQEATQTKMAVLGRGSMRDKAKEEELRKGNDPKYNHLNEDLHVEITAFAPVYEAYNRMAKALRDLQRFLVPDYYDEIRQNQLRELALLNGEEPQWSDCHLEDGLNRLGCNLTPPSGRICRAVVNNRIIYRNPINCSNPADKDGYVTEDSYSDHICDAEYCALRDVNCYDYYPMPSEDLYDFKDYGEMQHSLRGKMYRPFSRIFRRDHPYFSTHR
ncbi:KH domain-containing, RNA-binding, signal transduction-associated protein 3-like [Centruroides vittatus]|uniref:KH domain-containing, RNA-binding, signal transduction-associated protein 3-like n=1 Tax=Centruroides vittatus TaxID=120091 RepID=UPI00350FE2C6